jgi:hypothetical protein
VSLYNPSDDIVFVWSFANPPMFRQTPFMYATGYPPTSIHLGRGKSWTPLFQPYNPNGPVEDHEAAVIRDLNNARYQKCQLPS